MEEAEERDGRGHTAARSRKLIRGRPHKAANGLRNDDVLVIEGGLLQGGQNRQVLAALAHEADLEAVELLEDVARRAPGGWVGVEEVLGKTVPPVDLPGDAAASLEWAGGAVVDAGCPEAEGETEPLDLPTGLSEEEEGVRAQTFDVQAAKVGEGKVEDKAAETDRDPLPDVVLQPNLELQDWAQGVDGGKAFEGVSSDALHFPTDSLVDDAPQSLLAVVPKPNDGQHIAPLPAAKDAPESSQKVEQMVPFRPRHVDDDRVVERRALSLVPRARVKGERSGPSIRVIG